ncbi:MAG: SMP-30/gluconolactonase/LRE family protein [Chloroflexi bacterium]|nr:SMP-30/gluconolactonase/LRE family protein [Chloroflexota bacterium]
MNREHDKDDPRQDPPLAEGFRYRVRRVAARAGEAVREAPGASSSDDMNDAPAQARAEEIEEIELDPEEFDYEELQPAPYLKPGFVAYLIGGLAGVVLGGLTLVLVLIYLNRSRQPAPAPAQLPAVVQLTSQGTSNAAVATTATVVPQPTPQPNATPAALFDAGPAGVNKGQLNLPRGIAQDPNGNFFVADTQNFRIQKYDKAGKFITAFGAEGDADGQFNPMNPNSVGTGPGGVAVDAQGSVYVADTWNHRIQKFDNNGKFITQWGGFLSLLDDASTTDPNKESKFWGPRGVAVGPDGAVYVTDTGNKRVLIFDASGKFLRKIDSGMSKEKADAKYPFDKPGELNEPIGIVVDGSGNIYVADTRNSRIQKFDKDGKPLAQWAVPANDWATGTLLEPFLAIDGAGNIYATAPTGGTVLKFSSAGQLSGQKNKEGAVTLSTPTGITVTPDGTVYVVDTSSSRVVNLGKIP